MNRRPPGPKLSKAISGFVQHKTAAGLASTIIQGYERDLKKWVTHIGDVDIGDVTTQEVRDYLAWLRTEYKPHRWKKSDDPLSPKTLRNVWVTLSAFFRWASIELDVPNPMKAVPAPHFEEAPVEPFTQQDIEALLKAIGPSLRLSLRAQRNQVQGADGHCRPRPDSLSRFTNEARVKCSALPTAIFCAIALPGLAGIDTWS